MPHPTMQMLTYYELDLGLNNVTRRWTQETDRGANGLIPVPGGSSGPGGVLVLAENWIWWEHENHESLRTPIPRRNEMPDERGLLLISHATHRKRDLFFFLVQSELGDLYKVSCFVQTVDACFLFAFEQLKNLPRSTSTTRRIKLQI